MDFIQYIALAIITLAVSIIGSLAQGGGNFIMLPLLLMFGLSPAVANGTLTVGGMGFVAGSIAALRKIKISNMRALVAMTSTGVVSGLFVPLILARINGDIYSLVIGIMLFGLAPVLYKKPFGQVSTQVRARHEVYGAFYLLLLFVTARLTLGVGALFSLVLCKYFGLDVFEANAVRKYSGLISGIFTTAWVTLAGFVDWHVAAVLIPVSVIGAYIGNRLLIKKGSKWAVKAMIFAMVFSGFALIATSI
jgi:uncharacterized membrane protein YfcA